MECPKPSPMPPPPAPAKPGSQATMSAGRPSSSSHRCQSLGNQSVSTSYSASHSGRVRSASTPFNTASGRISRTASSIGASENHQVICAVSEARGVSPSIGIAFINISTGEAILSQINDTQFYIRTIHKIQVFEPCTILMTATSCPPNPKSTLLTLLEAGLPGVPVIPLSRKYWSEAAGLEFVQALAFKEDAEAVKFAIEGKFYATSAFSAAMKYLELESSVKIASHSLRIKYQPSEDSMMIDLSTIQSLELIQNLHNSQSRDCLFGLLSHTVTPMGSRTLRSNILQPSTMKDLTLIPRYDAVEELATKEEMFFHVRKALREFSDVEKLLTKLVILPKQDSLQDSEQAINTVLMIKSFVRAMPALYESLASARSVLLTKIRDLCRPAVANEILGLISETINEDVVFVSKPLDLRNQRTYAVKAGVLGLLDVARKTYKEANDDLYQHVQDLNAELDLAGDLKFDNDRRYYLSFRAIDLEDRPMPDAFINRVRKKEYLECQTLTLLKFNQRISDSVNEVVMQSDGVIKQLLDRIRPHVAAMFKVCEGIALLDMLTSFSHLVTTRDYVRPDLAGTLALKSARHPIIEAPHPEKFVPNDYYATNLYRFQTITGCNMSGKSTYIRTIALLQVMAQIGCFVPAQYAGFAVIYNLFARVSTDDSIEANMSTFSVEMREMAYILRNVNDKSLAIIDELGRGTSTRDGLAIAIAMAEALIQSNATVFFATHFTELAKVLSDRPGVLNLHLATETTRNEEEIPMLAMLYKVASGHVQDENYGIKLARAIGFPGRFIATAEAVTKRLKEQAEAKKATSQARKLAARRKLVLALRETLVQAEQGDLDDASLAMYLRSLQREFVARMEAIENGGDDLVEDESVSR